MHMYEGTCVCVCVLVLPQPIFPPLMVAAMGGDGGNPSSPNKLIRHIQCICTTN